MIVESGWIALAGTIAGGVIGVAGKTLSDLFTVRKDRETREHQRKVDAEKWQREQLLNFFISATRAVNLYINSAILFPNSGNDVVPLQNDPGIRQASADLQAQLTAIVLLHPAESQGAEFRQFLTNVDAAMWKSVPTVNEVWPVRQLLLLLAAKFRPAAISYEHL